MEIKNTYHVWIPKLARGLTKEPVVHPQTGLRNHLQRAQFWEGFFNMVPGNRWVTENFRDKMSS